MRRLLAVLCVALILLATIAPAASAHFSDVLQPLWLALFPVVALLVVRRSADSLDEQPVPLHSPLIPRAPPAAVVLV